MSKPLIVVSALVAAARIASAQPATVEPPQTPSPPQASSPPLESPAEEPPPLPPPPPAPTPYDKCRAERHAISERAEQSTDLKERTRLLQSMPQCSPEMTVAPPASEEPVVTAASPQGGFAFEVRLETAQTLIDSDAWLPGTQGGIFIGSHSRSLMLGIGLELTRLTNSQSSSPAPESSHSLTSLLISPGLRAVLARTSDERTELIGQLDIGYGAVWSSDSTAMVDAPSTRHMRVQMAPGVRYWVSPSFAVGGSAGLRYDRYSRSDAMFETSSAVTSVFSSLQLTGVF